VNFEDTSENDIVEANSSGYSFLRLNPGWRSDESGFLNLPGAAKSRSMFFSQNENSRAGVAGNN
jgi:hypothetical protein